MFEGASSTFREAFTGSVNLPHEDIYRNIRINIRRQLPQLQPYPENKYKVALLLGGPSLAKAKIPRGYKIATVNGTHDWALQHNLKPSVHVMLDPRPLNTRFVENPHKSCRFIIHSQCDPGVFDALKERDVHIWHSAGKKGKERQIFRRFYADRWQRVLGGSSVGTCAIGILYILGVRALRVYGMDSCLSGNKHHAYEQPENDSMGVCVVKVGRRKFKTNMWMLAQVDDFLQIAPHIPSDMKLSLEGDGLLQYIVKETTRRGKPPKMQMETSYGG